MEQSRGWGHCTAAEPAIDGSIGEQDAHSGLPCPASAGSDSQGRAQPCLRQLSAPAALRGPASWLCLSPPASHDPHVSTARWSHMGATVAAMQLRAAPGPKFPRRRCKVAGPRPRGQRSVSRRPGSRSDEVQLGAPRGSERRAAPPRWVFQALTSLLLAVTDGNSNAVWDSG